MAKPSTLSFELSSFVDNAASQFKNLNPNEPGQWPTLPKAAAWLAAIAAAVAAGWFLLLADADGELEASRQKEPTLKADYRTANARQIQAVFDFERTLLMAFTEVVNYLAMVENLRNRFERQKLQVETLEAAVDTSNILYQSARADYMEVLLTRRDALEAEMELIETRKAQRQAIVGIYRALGGGWRRE